MQHRGQLFIDAGIALVIVITAITIVYSALEASLMSINDRKAIELQLLAEIERQMSTCYAEGGAAKCSENYYFYGELDPRSYTGNASAMLCLSRYALRSGEVVEITACG